MQDADDLSTNTLAHTFRVWGSDLMRRAFGAIPGLAVGFLIWGGLKGKQAVLDEWWLLVAFSVGGGVVSALIDFGILYLRTAHAERDKAIETVREHEDRADTAVFAMLDQQDICSYYRSDLPQTAENIENITVVSVLAAIGPLIIKGAPDQAILLQLARKHGERAADSIYGQTRDKLLRCGAVHVLPYGERSSGLITTDSGRRIVKELTARAPAARG